MPHVSGLWVHPNLSPWPAPHPFTAAAFGLGNVTPLLDWLPGTHNDRNLLPDTSYTSVLLHDALDPITQEVKRQEDQELKISLAT